MVSFIDTKKSVAYDEFVDASLDFVPLVSFYTVSNKQLAKSLGMKTVGYENIELKMKILFLLARYNSTNHL